jgi:hypothetical protein
MIATCERFRLLSIAMIGMKRNPTYSIRLISDWAHSALYIDH